MQDVTGHTAAGTVPASHRLPFSRHTSHHDPDAKIRHFMETEKPYSLEKSLNTASLFLELETVLEGGCLVEYELFRGAVRILEEVADALELDCDT